MTGSWWRQEAQQIRRAIRELGPRGKTERLPAGIRERVTAYVAEGRAVGASWNALARATGLSSTTLQRWQASAIHRNQSQALVPVCVEAGPGSLSASGSTVVIHNPTGWRVEGVEVADAITILRELG